MSKDRLNINYWLRKIYVSKIFQYLPFSKIFQRKIIFTSIFKSKHWVQKSNLPKKFQYLGMDLILILNNQ